MIENKKGVTLNPATFNIGMWQADAFRQIASGENSSQRLLIKNKSTVTIC